MSNPETITDSKPARIERSPALKYTIACEYVQNLYLPKGKKAILIKLSNDFFPQYSNVFMKAMDISLKQCVEELNKVKQNPLLDITYRTLVKKLEKEGVIHLSPTQERDLKLHGWERGRKPAFLELCNLHQKTRPDSPINLTLAADLLGCKKQRTFQIYHELKDNGKSLPPIITHEKIPK